MTIKSIIKKTVLNEVILNPLLSLVKPKLIIFNYHRIYKDKKTNHFDDDVLSASEEQFEKQILWFKKNTEVITEEILIDIINGKKNIDRNMSMITFDDGYRDNYEIAFPILKRHNVKACFYIPTEAIESRQLGWWDLMAYFCKTSTLSCVKISDVIFELPKDQIKLSQYLISRIKLLSSEKVPAYLEDIANKLEVNFPSKDLMDSTLMSWEQIKELSSAGMGVGSHTVTHQILSRQSLVLQKNELEQSKLILEEKIGKEVLALAYPVGGYEHFNVETKELARKAGYKLAMSYQTGFNFHIIDPYDVKRIDIQPQWANLEFVYLFPEKAFNTSNLLPGPIPSKEAQ